MSGISAYLFRLLCAAVLCAVVNAICGDTGRGIRRLIAGAFLCAAALSFPEALELSDLNPKEFLREAESLAAEGTAQAMDAKIDIITDGFRSYIWNKAAALGLEPEIQVQLHEDLTPESVILTGSASPAERDRLRRIIARELGIGEEDVVWREAYQSSE